ncbi:uncharacterized protein LOC135841599 isoform X1 [Planococcus citri]|uniref:uncharacterized protein LOC135841599 isoform X1 n=1 Tax=Planococcus citri TaxID=170843 RepID=UPI0031F79632
MLTHDSISKCCDNLLEMEPSYRTKSSLNKNLFSQKETGYSSHSIIQCMENFVEAVHEMDDTILVPSRLMDLKVENVATTKTSSQSHANCNGYANDHHHNSGSDYKSSSLVAILTNLPDLFTLYTMVRNLKNQLQWGMKDQPRAGAGDSADEDCISQHSGNGIGGCYVTVNPIITSSVFLNAPLLTSVKGHIRRPSTASVSSTNSSAASVISDPDSEASMENDSGIDAELDACTKMSTLEIIEHNFQRHLRGLGDTLNQLTEAARYVTKRYQKDVLGAE